MSLEKTKRINLLLDVYSNMLTDKQKEIMDMYYGYDLSLSEIAQELNVTRTAVFDLIKRTTALLEKYEANIQMLALKEKLYEAIEDFPNKEKTKILEILQDGDEDGI